MVVISERRQPPATTDRDVINDLTTHATRPDQSVRREVYSRPRGVLFDAQEKVSGLDPGLRPAIMEG